MEEGTEGCRGGGGREQGRMRKGRGKRERGGGGGGRTGESDEQLDGEIKETNRQTQKDAPHL